MSIGKGFFCIILVLAILPACEDNPDTIQTLDSEGQDTPAPESTQASSDSKPENPAQEIFYTVTNNFQDIRGRSSGKHIRLTSVNTGAHYVVPPTQYGPLELEYIRVDMKVAGDCVTIPATAFPVVVGVCETNTCQAVQSLNTQLNTPAHYNIGGLGKLFLPQVYPVSPCSEELVKIIGSESPSAL